MVRCQHGTIFLNPAITVLATWYGGSSLTRVANFDSRFVCLTIWLSELEEPDFKRIQSGLMLATSEHKRLRAQGLASRWNDDPDFQESLAELQRAG
jgi:hypothetical protein